jgi:hypothetical protein
MKRIIVIIIIVIFSSSQIGCNKKQTSDTSRNNPSPQEEPNKSMKNPSAVEEQSSVGTINGEHTTQEIRLMRKPNKTKYLLSNGIEIQREDKAITTKKGEVTISLPKVFGLKDKALEERLNKSIEIDIENQVKDYVDERVEKPTALYPIIELNANNLLSISLRDLYSHPLYGFLYRLTDGKMLYLKDIFTVGTDYVPLINQKVVEGILMEDGEENYLSKPFTTIKQDQNFVLSEAALYIVFHAGEEGFLERNSVSIPLSTVDDYVDVTDRYSGTERKTQERSDLIIRKNNIFFTNKSSIVKKANGDVWTYYPQISGLRDAAFEEEINNNIKDGTSEVVNNKYLDGLVKVKDQMNDYIALIQMQVVFNYYGVLCIRRDVSSFDSSKDLQQFNTVYNYDLIKKKAINPKDMIRSYITKNKDLEGIFTKLIKDDLTSKYGSIINEINSSIDYSFIMDKGQIYFSKYYLEDEMKIEVHFNVNALKGASYTMDSKVLFKDIIKGAPEDFFGW